MWGMNKNKEYVRTFPCFNCGGDVTAKYDTYWKRWHLTCHCGKDTYFKTLNKEVWRLK